MGTWHLPDMPLSTVFRMLGHGVKDHSGRVHHGVRGTVVSPGPLSPRAVPHDPCACMHLGGGGLGGPSGRCE